MNIRLLQTTMFSTAALLVVALSAVISLPPRVAVAANEPCPAGTIVNTADGACTCPEGFQFVTVAIDDKNTHCIPINDKSNQINDNPIYFYLKGVLRFMAAGVGLAVTGGVVFGGYMYITARANAGQVEKAKTVIINSIIGLVLFIFMFAILQFLIPGGIFV